MSALAESNPVVSDVLGNPRIADLVIASSGLHPRVVAGQKSTAIFRVIAGTVHPADVEEWAEHTRFIDADMMAIVGQPTKSAALSAATHRIDVVDASEIVDYWRTGEPSSEYDITTCWIDVDIRLAYVLHNHVVFDGPIEIQRPSGWVQISAFDSGVATPQMFEHYASLAQELPIPPPGRSLTRRNKVDGHGQVLLRAGRHKAQAELHIVVSATIHNTGTRTETVFEGVRSRFTAEVIGSAGKALSVPLAGTPARVLGPLDELRRNFEVELASARPWPDHIEAGFAATLAEYRSQGPVSPDQTSDHYTELAQRIGPIVTASTPTYKEQWFLRARQSFDDHELLRRDPAQFGVPPTHLVGLGRANLAGHPVFYGADHAHTAVREVMPWQEGAAVYVSSWRSGDYRPSYVRALAAGESNTERVNRERNRLITSAQSRERYIGKEATAAVKQIAIGLGRVFLDDENYALSSMIAHHHLYDQQADGLEYPDVATESAFNYALGPAMFDKLQLHRVFLFRIHNDHLDPVDVGIPNTRGELDWQPFDADVPEHLIPREVGQADEASGA